VRCRTRKEGPGPHGVEYGLASEVAATCEPTCFTPPLDALREAEAEDGRIGFSDFLPYTSFTAQPVALRCPYLGPQATELCGLLTDPEDERPDEHPATLLAL